MSGVPGNGQIYSRSSPFLCKSRTTLFRRNPPPSFSWWPVAVRLRAIAKIPSLSGSVKYYAVSVKHKVEAAVTSVAVKSGQPADDFPLFEYLLSSV